MSTRIISEADRRANVDRPLTHPLDYTEEGLAVNATRACSIDDCNKAARGRGWCSTHWLRWREHGDPNYVRVRVTRSCRVADCTRRHYAADYCSMHYSRKQRHGDPLDPGKPHSGRHKLDRPGYAAAHKRVSRALGKASDRTCVDCNQPAREWSYNGGSAAEIVGDASGHVLAWSPDIADYSPRCRPCHRRMDESLNRCRDALGRFTSALPGEATGVGVTIRPAVVAELRGPTGETG